MGPLVHCMSCGKQRRCELHQRAEFPPDAARAWLKKTCKNRDLCELEYRAGLLLSSPRSSNSVE